jgi:DNA-binding NtrC family response regulator
VPTPIYENINFPGVVLVVEDEASVRVSLARLLNMKGINAIVVATADDALTKINRQEIPTRLADMRLQSSGIGQWN